MNRFTVMLLCLVCAVGRADENPWETQRTEPFLIRTRTKAGTGLKEVWAEADLKATVLDIQDALIDVTKYPQFMPYMTESRFLGEREADGARYTYSKHDIPVLSARDVVHKSYVDRDARTDPEGVFENHWFAEPKKIPERSSVVRLKTSEGSWKVSPSADGKSSHVLYRVCVDPGGAVPNFIANRANASGLSDTFKNIEREAQRRAAARPK
jgi:ribosome-associated toxin RatA of RatAB toxin-antitoxin module